MPYVHKSKWNIQIQYTVWIEHVTAFSLFWLEQMYLHKVVCCSLRCRKCYGSYQGHKSRTLRRRQEVKVKQGCYKTDYQNVLYKVSKCKVVLSDTKENQLNYRSVGGEAGKSRGAGEQVWGFIQCPGIVWMGSWLSMVVTEIWWRTNVLECRQAGTKTRFTKIRR